MSPLMQTIFDYLDEYGLERYLNGFERDARAAECDRLYRALSAALPESCQELLEQYAETLFFKAHLEAKAMFQAAFAAARELS